MKLEGSLFIAPSTTTLPNINLALGVAPTTPSQGDIWSIGTDILFYDGTSAKSMIASGGSPTALSIGTVTGTTFGITSDGGTDDVVLPAFNGSQAGLTPSPAGATTTFLKADGTWATPTDTNTQLSDAQVETGYNNQVSAGTDAEITTGTETAIRRWSPIELNQAITALSSNTNFAEDDLLFDASHNHDLAGNFVSIESPSQGFNDTLVVRGDLTVATVDLNAEVRHSGYYTYEDTDGTNPPLQLHQELVSDIGRLTFEGTTGSLLTIIDDKDNELWTASDVSGNPIGYIDADWLVQFGNPFNRPFKIVYDSGTGASEIFLDLPTSAGTAGSLWNDAGTVKIA